MNHTNEKLVRERGPVRVAWVCLGEGYNGDYDPKNPEDELLLRFDVAVKNEDIGSFVTIESRCTCFAANASARTRKPLWISSWIVSTMPTPQNPASV